MEKKSLLRFDRAAWRHRLLGLLLLSIVGCNSGPQVAPVSGKVLYNGKPLPYGVVMFQPAQGQLAQGEIQPDGTFSLSTFRLNDGAVVGTHRVSVMCHEGHNPTVREKMPPDQFTLGESLIPLNYSRIGTSGLTVDVPPDGRDDVVLELSSGRR